MALREFSRLTDRLLAHLGEEAVLRGEVVVPPRRVNVEHGVDFADANDQAVFSRSIATISKVDLPEKGDTLEMIDADGLVVASFKLDALLKDNGYSRQFILIGYTPPVIP